MTASVTPFRSTGPTRANSSGRGSTTTCIPRSVWLRSPGTTRHLIAGGFAYRYKQLDLPIDMKAKVFNGYLYFSWQPLVPEADRAAMIEQYTGVKQEHTPLAMDYWERAVPELRGLYAWIAAVAVDECLPTELADGLGRRLESSPASLGDPFLCDHRAVPGHGRPGRPVRIGSRGGAARARRCG